MCWRRYRPSSKHATENTKETLLLKPTHHEERYRPNVGLALFGKDGRVFLGQRVKTPPPFQWQMPQGGVDKGEQAGEAALRELEEEVGIGPKLVDLLDQTPDWLYYDFPPEIQSRLGKRDKYYGQKQKWFAFRYLGSDADIRIQTAHPEFTAWRWGMLEEAPALVIPFKRAIYEEIVKRFAPYTRPLT
jgi:putative (di)nucleoside polyphosphate hydrolase